MFHIAALSASLAYRCIAKLMRGNPKLSARQTMNARRTTTARSRTKTRNYY